MLQTIREKTSGWFAWAVIIAIAVVFAIWGVLGYMGASPGGENPIAKVNGEVIDKRTFLLAYQREQQIASQSRQQPLDEQQLQKRTLEGLIVDSLRLQDAQKANIKIGKDLIDNFIALTPELQKEGKFSPELFEQFLAKIGLSKAEYFKLVQDNLTQYYMQIAIAGSEFILPTEVERDFAIAEQKRDVNYFIVPVEPYLNQSTISESDIEAFYKDNENQFIAPETVSVNYAVLSLQDLMSQINSNEADLNKFYDENHQHFMLPEERKLQHILLTVPKEADKKEIDVIEKKAIDISQQAKNGTNFANLAKQYSEDSASAQQGGELGWLPRGAAVKAFDDAVFAEEKAGTVIGPIRTPFGFHIVKVEEIKPAHLPAFAEIKDQVMLEYKHQKASDEFAKKQEQLAQAAYESPTSLDDVAKKLNLTIEKSPIMTKTGMMSKNDVLDNPAFVEAAFSEPVLAGNNSTVITLLPDQKVAVVHIAEHQPEHPMPLDQVKSKIEQVLRREAANKKMAEDVQKWLVDLNSKETLADLAKSMQLNVNQILVGRFEFMKYDPQLLRTVFAMPRPTDTSRSINATALSSGDYAVIQLNKVIDGEPTSEEKAMFDAYARNLTQIKAQLDYDLYLKGLYDHAKIKYFEK